jgi:hypothetical protein
MSINNKKMRRLSTAMVACALTITLASCSAANNKYGNLDKNATYASVGDYKITNGELWDTLQWDAKDVLDSQIYNVILDEQITRLKNVFNTNGSYSKLEDKKIIHGSNDDITEEEFNKLYDKYKNRIADYVVQDVFNFVYDQEEYWDKLDQLEDVEQQKLVKKYVDEMYITYQKSSIADGKTYEEILSDIGEDNIDGLFEIAKDLSELYYPLYAKELFTYDSLKDDVKEAFDDDDDDEDEKYGYYKNSEYIDMFKKKYTNQYNVNLIKIKFSSSTEFTDTLRAFGLYLYSTDSKFYYIYDDKDDQTVKTDYTSYISHYKDFTSTNTAKNLKTLGAEEVPSRAVLEIYIMLYNYMYGGYLDQLESASGVDISFDNLNELREQTLKLINKYKTGDSRTLYDNTVQLLKDFDEARDEDDKVLTFTPDFLKDTYSASFKTYCYETLKLKDDNDYDSFDTRYSTSLQSAGDSSFIVYKFDDTYDEIDDAKAKEYEEFYKDKDHTSLDYFEYLTKEENKQLFDDVLDALIWNNTSESIITNKINDALEDVKVKIYNEATEIAYAKEHEKYSKAVGSAKNKNILATIKYDGKTFNLNIKANDKDSKSIKVPGTDEAFGVYDYLERKSGASTAIDLLSKKIVKDTQQYKDALKDKTQKEIYNTYLKNVLSAFANDGYASNGYPSSLGKYNFLMLYYHTANVKKIINDYFMVQYVSSKLLTDYSNESLADFFKYYSDLAYDNYFSLSGKRLVIYMDADEDGKKDDAVDWLDVEVEWDGEIRTKRYIARELAYTIYNKLSAAANTSHATRLDELVDEIQNSAKAEYNENPAAAENVWAKYKKIGLNVEVEDISATNSSTEIDFALKQRLYDYAKKVDDQGNSVYQYFKNSQIPTEFIEQITVSAINDDEENPFVTSKDGVNLLIVTSGTDNASAEWKSEDYSDTPLKDIIIKYNEKYVKISDIYNEDKQLNKNQIMLYILDNAVNNGSTLSPADTSAALSSFLDPVYKRFTSSETQRIVLLYFMKTYIKSNDNIYDIVKFENESYNGSTGFFKSLIEINQTIADDYSYLNNDTTGTSDLYPDWWEKIEEQIKNFLIDVKEAE